MKKTICISLNSHEKTWITRFWNGSFSRWVRRLVSERVSIWKPKKTKVRPPRPKDVKITYITPYKPKEILVEYIPPYPAPMWSVYKLVPIWTLKPKPNSWQLRKINEIDQITKWGKILVKIEWKIRSKEELLKHHWLDIF
jgi:hypothetical protein